MPRIAMAIIEWTRPAGGRHPARQTKRHVSIDDTETVCGYEIPQGANTITVTPDWHKEATCYNCVYRLWDKHAPDGYERPISGSDFPLRRSGQRTPIRQDTPTPAAPSSHLNGTLLQKNPDPSGSGAGTSAARTLTSNARPAEGTFPEAN